jgi:hypothetical protein
MDTPFEQKSLQELVLYRAIIHRGSSTADPVTLRKRSNFHAGTSSGPLELNPGVKRIFEKLQRRIFYHSDWWSVIHSDKGLVIDLLV